MPIDYTKKIFNDNTAPAIDDTFLNNLEDIAIRGAENIGMTQDTYDNTETYEIDDIVVYNSYIYRCIQDISIPEDFDASKWLKITLAKNIENTQKNKKDIGDLEDLETTTKDNLVEAINEVLETGGGGGGGTTIYNNAGAHNSIYRGKDITDLFYNGTLSTQIANGTFDDIFIGDYIIGQSSGTKYLVADINYRLHTGNTECTTNHILMIPENIMGTAQMNASNITTGAYVGSAMYTTNLAPFKTVIQNDFGSGHILSHRNYLKNAVTNGYESAVEWKDSTIELMNEHMVYGSDVFHNITNGTNIPQSHEIDKTQLSIFRHRPDLIVARGDNNSRISWWLRDVVSSATFAYVYYYGLASYDSASLSHGVRPAFLVY